MLYRRAKAGIADADEAHKTSPPMPSSKTNQPPPSRLMTVLLSVLTARLTVAIVQNRALLQW